MKELVIGEIEQAIAGNLICGKKDFTVTNVSRDSREVNKQTLFFFLIGERLDGHDFIKEVVAKGCTSLVISNQKAIENIDANLVRENKVNIIIVEDTTVALQKLGKFYLEKNKIKVIGVTGSVGKTSTKDMAYAILSHKYNTGRNLGNYNNHIGLPLSILNFEDDVEIGVLEMGMSNFGEIKQLASTARPEVAIITNIGTSHIENLGSREGIFKEKMEITTYFDENNTLVYLPEGETIKDEAAGLPLGEGRYKTMQIISKEARRTMNQNFPKENRESIYISNIKDQGERGVSFTLEYRDEKEDFDINATGRHNATNCALAVGAAISLGMSLRETAQGIGSLEMTKGRGTIFNKGEIKIIDDTYNASPASMKAALDTLESVGGERKVAFLGEMLEMGEKATFYHKEVGQYAAGKKIDIIVTVGKMAQNIGHGIDCQQSEIKVIAFDTKEETIKNLGKILKPGDTTLFKASRGVKLEEIIEHI